MILLCKISEDWTNIPLTLNPPLQILTINNVLDNSSFYDKSRDKMS